MGSDIPDKTDSTELAAFYALQDLAWVVPLVFCGLGYFVLEFRGWNLGLFVALCILGSICLAFYSVAEIRERRAKRLKANQDAS